jgi:para-nitrobenzyl esterase
MRLRPVMAAAALAALVSASSAMAQAPAPTISTADGSVSGVRHQAANAYLGIPFAQPPVGALRWKPPAKPAAWSGVRDGSQFGTNCYQDPPGHFGPYTDEFLIQLPVSEDCLYLNVWTPAKAAKGKLPVILWLHGGGHGSGSGSIPIYNGAGLASKGVVVVSANFRLGPFGYLAHPELTAESTRHTSGNYGLLDQIAALQWVKANAARFGGDPSRVTIMGQSAGAADVHALIMAPEAKGLFVRAIAESGAGRAAPLAEAEAQGQTIAFKAGAHSLAELRATPADAIQRASAGPPPLSGAPPGPRFGLVIDGQVLPADPSDPAAPVASNVPLLAGYTSDDIGTSPLDTKTSAADFEKTVRQRYGAHADAILAVYPHANDVEASQSALRLQRDQLFATLVSWEADRAKASGETVYAYRYDHTHPGPNSAKYGAFHTSEVPYVFGVLNAPGRTFTAGDRKVSDQIQGYWVNFATRGDPNPAGKTTWKRVTPGSMRLMEIGDHPGMRLAGSSQERLDALQRAK